MATHRTIESSASEFSASCVTADLLKATLDRLLGDRALLEQVPYVVCVTDRAHRVVYLNRTVPGRELRDFIGTSALDSVPASHHARLTQVLERAWETAQPQSYAYRSLSGFHWESIMVPIKVPIKDRGEVRLLVVTSLDVTRRVLAEEALRDSETRLHETLKAAGVGTFAWAAGSGRVEWDSSLSHIWGDVSRAPRNYREYLALVHREDRERVSATVKRCLADAQADEVEHRVVCPDGELRCVLAKITAVHDTQGEVSAVHGCLFDVTERRRLQEQLQHAQKMEAIGQLTAGIAHNFNNLLGVVLPNIDLCLDEAIGETRERLLDAQNAARRAAEVIRDLMLFARPKAELSKTLLRMDELCRSVVDVCRRALGPRIAIELNIPAELLRVQGSAAQLEQVLLNICFNAGDAMRGAATPSALIRMTLCLEAGEQVRIDIEDNGPGMDEATRRRVFEPFFTTKQPGYGTGLGLASAYAVVHEHDGSICCSSRLGAGARFEIRLPCAPEQAQASVTARPFPQQAASAQGTLLLVDDEPLVRRALRGIIERAGYAVLEASGGEEALRLVERHGERIDLLLLDESMPDMCGTQVVEHLCARGSTIPIVMVSGVPLAGHARVAARLAKPTPARELLRVLADVLRARETTHDS